MGLAEFYQNLPFWFKRKCSNFRLFKLYNIGVMWNRYRIAEVDGVKFHTDLYTYVGSSMYHLGVYERDTANIIEKYVRAGDICVDVGSSIGAHSLRMSKIVGPKGRVYTFEPSKYLYGQFLENIKLNSFLIYDVNIVAERMALSDKMGMFPIRQERLGYLSGDTPEQPLENVEFITLDGYVKKKKIKKIDFIKIDVDGVECEVLRGAMETFKSYFPYIVLEVRGQSVGEATGLLAGLGYEFYDECSFKKLTKEELTSLEGVQNIFCMKVDEDAKKKNTKKKQTKK